MNRRAKAIVNAIVTLLIFTVFPLILPRYLPKELLVLFSQSSIDIIALLNEIAILGVVLAVITIILGFFDEASPVNLIVSVFSNIAWLILMIVFLGFGSIERLGLVEISSNVAQATNKLIVDIRFFVYLAIVGTALKVVQSILKFRESRITKKLRAKQSNIEEPIIKNESTTQDPSNAPVQI